MQAGKALVILGICTDWSKPSVIDDISNKISRAGSYGLSRTIGPNSKYFESIIPSGFFISINYIFWMLKKNCLIETASLSKT